MRYNQLYRYNYLICNLYNLQLFLYMYYTYKCIITLITPVKLYIFISTTLSML